MRRGRRVHVVDVEARGEARMEKRELGRSGIKVPPLMFGGNVFGWTADEATSFRLLDALLAAGFNSIDTADVYSAGCRATRAASPRR